MVLSENPKVKEALRDIEEAIGFSLSKPYLPHQTFGYKPFEDLSANMKQLIDTMEKLFPWPVKSPVVIEFPPALPPKPPVYSGVEEFVRDTQNVMSEWTAYFRKVLYDLYSAWELVEKQYKSLSLPTK